MGNLFSFINGHGGGHKRTRRTIHHPLHPDVHTLRDAVVKVVTMLVADDGIAADPTQVQEQLRRNGFGNRTDSSVSGSICHAVDEMRLAKLTRLRRNPATNYWLSLVTVPDMAETENQLDQTIARFMVKRGLQETREVLTTLAKFGPAHFGLNEDGDILEGGPDEDGIDWSEIGEFLDD